METRVKLNNGQTFGGDLNTFHDISIPVQPLITGDKQTQAFSLPVSVSKPVRCGTWVGDTRQGSSVNCEEVVFCPHGNGTHTECVGHITKERISMADVNLGSGMFTAIVCSVTPQTLAATGDHYDDDCPNRPDDLVIGLRPLCAVFEKLLRQGEVPSVSYQAIVLRTLDKDGALDKKAGRNWNGSNPVYLTGQASAWLQQQGFQHLLVDLPSVDRENDGGHLKAHKAFFNVGKEPAISQSTVTELCDIPEAVKDGLYMLSLQVSPFYMDAAPSRPLLFPLTLRS